MPLTSQRSEIRPGSRLFCTAAPDLAPRTPRTPGEFGGGLLDRVVLQTEDGQITAPEPGWTGVVMLELAWETVRLREYPDRPGRLDCLFLWETEPKARDFSS